MTKGVADQAICAFHDIERGRGKCGALRRVPAIARLGVTLVFLLSLVSHGKYDLAGVVALAVYPFALFLFEGVPLLDGLANFWYVLVPVIFVGAANPFFDREVVASVCGIDIVGGWLSFSVLCLKGVLALAAGWSFLRLTGAEGIARAFESLHLPPSFGFSFLLMHRYLVMMVKETNRMRDAYLLRSGSRKAALKPAAWGPFVGLLLMRSFDRARTVQEALELRGGVPNRVSSSVGHDQSTFLGIMYMVVWGGVFVILMWYEPVRRIGDFVRGAFS